MWKFIRHEWKFWLSSPMTWIFLFINTLLVMGAVSSEYVTIDDLFENITLFSNRTIEAKYKKIGDEYEVTLKTTSEKFRADSQGKEKDVALADYVDIGVFAEPVGKKNLGKPLVIKRLKLINKENIFTFRTNEKPYQAGIDPYNYLVDRIPDDNLKKLDEE